MGLIKLRNLPSGAPVDFTGENLLAIAINHPDMPYETRSFTCNDMFSGTARDFTGYVRGGDFTEFLRVSGVTVATGIIEDSKIILEDGNQSELASFTLNQFFDQTYNVLPKATSTVLGAIKVGNGFLITSDGTTTLDYDTFRVASSNSVGVVRVGDGLNIDNNGILSAALDSLPIATNAVLGAIKVGGGLSAAADGTLSITNWGSASEGAVYTSDIYLKDDVKKIKNPISLIDRINGVTFSWNEKTEKNGQKDIGVIAQEVRDVMPEAVEVNQEGNLTVAYHKIIPLLIECIKNQEDRINKLESRLC
jgi:hypothetical protein